MPVLYRGSAHTPPGCCGTHDWRLPHTSPLTWPQHALCAPPMVSLQTVQGTWWLLAEPRYAGSGIAARTRLCSFNFYSSFAFFARYIQPISLVPLSIFPTAWLICLFLLSLLRFVFLPTPPHLSVLWPYAFDSLQLVFPSSSTAKWERSLI